MFISVYVYMYICIYVCMYLCRTNRVCIGTDGMYRMALRWTTGSLPETSNLSLDPNDLQLWGAMVHALQGLGVRV